MLNREPPASVCVTRSRFSVTESAPRMGRLSSDSYLHTCHSASAVNWRPACRSPDSSCEALGSKLLAQVPENRLSPDNGQSARTAPRRAAPTQASNASLRDRPVNWIHDRHLNHHREVRRIRSASSRSQFGKISPQVRPAAPRRRRASGTAPATSSASRPVSSYRSGRP